MNDPLPSGEPQAPEGQLQQIVPVSPQHTERRIALVGEGMIQVEPGSISESYKRNHNTLFEALRILVGCTALILISLVTIPYRIYRKSWTKLSKARQTQ